MTSSLGDVGARKRLSLSYLFLAAPGSLVAKTRGDSEWNETEYPTWKPGLSLKACYTLAPEGDVKKTSRVSIGRLLDHAADYFKELGVAA